MRYDEKKSGLEGRSPGQVRPQVGGCPGVVRGEKSPASIAGSRRILGEEPEKHYKETAEENPVVVVPPRINGAAHRDGTHGPRKKKRKPDAPRPRRRWRR